MDSISRVPTVSEDGLPSQSQLQPLATTLLSGGTAQPEELELEIDNLRQENLELNNKLAKAQNTIHRWGDNREMLAEKMTELEVRIFKADQERAENEEKIAEAFVAVIKDLEVKMSALELELETLRSEQRGNKRFWKSK